MEAEAFSFVNVEYNIFGGVMFDCSSFWVVDVGHDGWNQVRDTLITYTNRLNGFLLLATIPDDRLHFHF